MAAGPDALENLIPSLLQRKGKSGQVRVWVPQCGAGDDAYSIGILLLDHAGELPPSSIQIFATDPDRAAFASSRLGVYQSGDEALPQRWLPYFEPDGAAYRIRPELRQVILFSEHLIGVDPSFRNIDLVSYRTIPDETDEETLGRVMNAIYFALAPEGFAYFGESSPKTLPDDRFSACRRSGLFQRREKAGRWSRSRGQGGRAAQGRLIEQSLNEELRAVNQELRARIEELARTEVALRDTHAVLEEKIRQRTSELLGAYRRVVSIQDDERRRISRDLHDQIGQRITALRLQLETLEAGRRVKPDRSQDGRLLEAAIESAEALDREVDSLTWALRPPALDQFGLTAALQDFVQKWAATFDVRADFIACGPSSPRLSPLVEGNVYQIVQEALNNIHKHARARSVRVSLERRTSEILLAIEDDGIGFDPAHTDDAHGIGLVGMRERTVLMGGTLGVTSAPGQGTKITARVPVEGGQW